MVVPARNMVRIREKTKMGTIQWNIGMGIGSLVYVDGSRPVKIPCLFLFLSGFNLSLFNTFLEMEYSRFIYERGLTGRPKYPCF